MKYHQTVLIVGITEVLMGGVTILFNLISLTLSLNPKSPSVLSFVIVAGAASLLIGAGLLQHNKLAYQLLLYFSSVIILSKLLIFMDVIHLNGALETTIPGPLKNISSIVYHGLVIFYLSKDSVKQRFYKEAPL